MARDPKDILAASTDAAGAAATPTVIDADEYDRAQRDDRWRDFCLRADRYVAETTRPAVRASARFAALLLGLGTLIGVVLLLMGVQPWLFYFAPLPTVPIAVRALHVWESQTATLGR